MLVIKFPKIKLIGKKAKTRFINKIESMEKFFLLKILMNELPNWIKWSKVKGEYIILKKKNNIPD